MTVLEQVKARKGHFDEMYDAFYAYFVKQLAQDDSKFNRYRLQHSAAFFDELELQQAVHPIFLKQSTTNDEKRAVARAAIYDALIAHTYGSFLKQVSTAIEQRVDVLEEKQTEILNAISKREQTVGGPKARQQK